MWYCDGIPLSGAAMEDPQSFGAAMESLLVVLRWKTTCHVVLRWNPS